MAGIRKRWLGRPGFGRRVGAVTAIAAAAVTLAPSTAAQAAEERGSSNWSVLMCKFHDVTAAPQSAAWFSRFFGPAGAGQGGLYDYWLGQSYNKLKITPSVHGWYTMPYTQAQEAPKSRWDKINDCVSTAASHGYTVPAGNKIAVITNAAQDSGSAGGRVILDPGAWNIRFAAHEMGHAYGLGHSYSNDTSYQNASWSGPGEYDDLWDEMSAQHVYGFETANFGNGGVGFNAYDRDRLGFLPINRVRTFGANGVSAATLTLAPLQQTVDPGALLVRVPFDPADLFHYYTVEYQRKLGWSRGIPSDTVLIHEVQNGRPTLLRNLSAPGKPPLQHLLANGVRIDVNSISSTGASVSLRTGIVDRCLQGYVWREANAIDHVCVTGATRSQVAADNAAAASRWVDGAYGPHTCVQGYVWREAFSGDDVCVTGATRSQAAYDNSQYAARRNPARFVYGPNACASGYVWREADASDYVCVSGATRAQAAADNGAKTSRWVDGAYGPHTCIQGYVWREAFGGDDVCVTGATRSQAAYDNTQIASRLASPQG